MKIGCQSVSREFQKAGASSSAGTNPCVAVHDVTFELPQGVTAGICGSSGAGKSTLLSLIGTLDIPTAGTITLGDTKITALSAHEKALWRRHHLGFIFQFHHLLKDFSVFENIAMPLWIDGQRGSGVTTRVTSLLERVGLADRAKSNANELSGGEAQRIAVARAVIHCPQIILADEPTGNLDEKNGLTVFDLLCELNHDLQATLLMVTHHSDFARRLDYQLVMAHGKLTEFRNQTGTCHGVANGEKFDT